MDLDDEGNLVLPQQAEVVRQDFRSPLQESLEAEEPKEPQATWKRQPMSYEELLPENLEN